LDIFPLYSHILTTSLPKPTDWQVQFHSQ